MRTPPLLVEDLMLLLLDDAKGYIVGEGARLQYILGGAVLVELAMAERLSATERWKGLLGPKVSTVGTDPLDDELLQHAFDQLTVKPRAVNSALIMVGVELRQPVLDRLAERGMVDRRDKKFLGLVPDPVWPSTGTDHEFELQRRVRAVLLDGAPADPWTAALIGLLSAGQVLPELDRLIPWSGAMYTRAREFEQAHWGPTALNRMITRITSSITAGAVAAGSAAASN